MARFLLTVWPLAGHLYPNVALAHAIRKRGHEVVFYTGPSAEGLLKGEGFEVFPFRKVDAARFDKVLFSSDEPVFWWKWRLDQAARYREWLVGMLPGQIEDLRELLPAVQPDVLVCDPMMWGPYAVLRELQPVTIAMFAYVPFCTVPSPDVPPLGLGLPPATNWKSRLWTRLVRTVQDRMTANIRRSVDEVRRQYGLAPLTESISSLAGKMPLYLVAGTRDLDYGRTDLPSTVHYVGPCLWSKPAGSAPAAWLDELPAGKPVVHVTEGTVHAKKPLVLSAAARGLANLPVSVVMATGTQRQPSQLGLEPLAPNVRVERWVVYDHLLPRTDLVVTTAGAGTVYAALAAGIPLVMIPTEWDKPEVAQRVRKAGAGVVLSPERCTPQRLRAAVDQVLGDPSFRQNARRLAADFQRHGGPAEAAQLLENLSLEVGGRAHASYQ